MHQTQVWGGEGGGGEEGTLGLRVLTSVRDTMWWKMEAYNLKFIKFFGRIY